VPRRRPGPDQPPLPDRDQILEFIAAQPQPVGKRDIARHFGVKGAARTALRGLLKELQDEGLLERGAGRRLHEPGGLPPVAVIEVVGPDADGEVIARPAQWRRATPPPPIYLAPERRPGRSPPGAGDRILARLSRAPDGSYEARPIKRLPARPTELLGIVRSTHDGARLVPTDRRTRTEFEVAPEDLNDAADGELVFAEVLPGSRRGQARARVGERLGDTDSPRAASLIAIHAAGIPTVFPDAALEQAARAGPAAVKARVDLRDLPLVTIDGADARDFDDAVFAEPAPHGWRVVVAIADVAWYVRPGDALDREAYRRGNSVYFPDRVVPMLPEALSNDLCSLRPAEDRACLAAELWIGADGALRRHRFSRGLMRSAARLTYTQVQAARDGQPDAATKPLMEQAIAPLYGAYAALAAARAARGALELDLPERTVAFAPDGSVAAVGQRERLDSHKLIEEFMIAANVAAAETLERHRRPCMYRIHDEPERERVEALAEVLREFDVPFARGQVLRPALFNRVIERVKDGPAERMISELVLRAQMQAAYSPDNIGHFGLGLRRYAHFTSPIRRYADLLVHRALIATLGRGAGPRDGALEPAAEERFVEAGEHLSTTERRAAAAERDALDRYVASFMASHVGAVFDGTITGVTCFGLFVRLAETGADGLVPVSTLGNDFYRHDEARHALVGDATGAEYRLGEPVEARLVEADPLTGSMVLHLMDAGPAVGGRGRPLRGHRGRPTSSRKRRNR